jgi:outer membrane protein OmpA-like peptidoglycan-associated protein
MKPDRWPVIAEIYEAAAELPDPERQAFLAASCGGDEDLRREFESLLAQNVSRDGVLERVAARAAAARSSIPSAIKINYRCATPLATATGAGAGGAGAGGGGGAATSASGGAAAIEHALSDTGKVDIYSIYFSFNSDVIREESEPTLRDIADVLRRHPEWRLNVNGPTDGVGSDQFNLDLSRRRSLAVKDALTKRYGIDAARLLTGGFGKSQPIDTNDTLEGRAHNRRVELAKIR